MKMLNKDKRIEVLEEALKALLEVQIRPSTEHEHEWEEAVHDARCALRNKYSEENFKLSDKVAPVSSLLKVMGIEKQYEQEIMCKD